MLAIAIAIAIQTAADCEILLSEVAGWSLLLYLYLCVSTPVSAPASMGSDVRCRTYHLLDSTEFRYPYRCRVRTEYSIKNGMILGIHNSWCTTLCSGAVMQCGAVVR